MRLELNVGFSSFLLVCCVARQTADQSERNEFQKKAILGQPLWKTIQYWSQRRRCTSMSGFDVDGGANDEDD